MFKSYRLLDLILMWVDTSLKKIVDRKMLAHLTLFKSIMLQIPYGKVLVESKKKFLFWNDFENSSEWLQRFFFSFSVDIFNFLELQNPFKNSCCNKHTPHFPNFEAIICFNVILFNQLSFLMPTEKKTYTNDFLWGIFEIKMISAFDIII